MRLVMLISIILGLWVPWSVAAASDGMTSTQFYRLTHMLMIRRDQHDKYIKSCADVTLTPVEKAELETAARNQNLQAVELIEQACRSLVKGIADGSITYTEYLKWMDEIDKNGGLVELPDWK